MRADVLVLAAGLQTFGDNYLSARPAVVAQGHAKICRATVVPALQNMGEAVQPHGERPACSTLLDGKGYCWRRCKRRRRRGSNCGPGRRAGLACHLNHCGRRRLRCVRGRGRSRCRSRGCSRQGWQIGEQVSGRERAGHRYNRRQRTAGRRGCHQGAHERKLVNDALLLTGKQYIAKGEHATQTKGGHKQDCQKQEDQEPKQAAVARPSVSLVAHQAA